VNALPKFVASSMLADAAWSNTTIISEDVSKAVARMKHEPGKDLAIFGSSTRVSTPAAHHLIDEYRFFDVPVLLGGGKRFLDGLCHRIALALQETYASGSGVVAQY
jgi:dihydrofolate reductase